MHGMVKTQRNAEYAAYAAETLKWAYRANNDRDREALLQLAETWLRAMSLSVSSPTAS